MLKNAPSFVILIFYSLFAVTSHAYIATQPLDETTHYQKFTEIFTNFKLNNTEKQQQGHALLFEIDEQKQPELAALIYVELLKIAADDGVLSRFKSLTEKIRDLPLSPANKTNIETLTSIAEVNLERKLGKHPAAIVHAESLLPLFEQVVPTATTNLNSNNIVLSIVDRAFLYYLLGNSHFLSTNYDLAHQYLLNAMTLYEQADDLNGQAIINTNLSMISWAQQNYQQALLHTDKALKIVSQLGDEQQIINNLLNKGLYFQNLKRYDNALASFQKILNHPNISQYTTHQIKTLLALADTLQSAGEYKNSEGYIQQALLISANADDKINLNTAKVALANLLTQQQKYDQALSFYLEAETFFQQAKLNRLQSVVLEALSKLYRLQDDYQKAFEYYEKFNVLTVDMLKSAQKTTVISLQEKYLAEKRNKQIALLEKEQKDNQNKIQDIESQRQFILLISAFSIIILSLLTSRYYNRKESKKLKQLNDAISENEDRLHLLSHAFKRTSDAVWIANKDFELVAVNNAFVQHTHKTRTDVIGKKLRFASVNGQDEMLADRILLQAKVSDSWQGQLYDQRSDEEIYPLELEVDSIKDDDNNITHYLGIFRDITEQRRAQEQLSRLATHDELTGLPNRALLEQLISQSCLTAKHTKKMPTLLLLDVNKFKKINDSYGHTNGDQVISEIGKRLKSVLYTKDVISRLNGAEFCILSELNDPKRSAVRVAQKVMSIFDKPFACADTTLNIKASMGITVYPQDGDNSEDLMRKAAIAMLDVSNSDTSGYRFYEPRMNTAVTKQLEREQKILNAINNDYFDFYYQPIVSVEGKKIVGAEALIRWIEPDGKIISPADFIPVAENAGFIDQIDRITINRVFEQLADWQQRGFDYDIISINLSGKMFLHAEELITMLTAKLSQYGIPASTIKLEITEGMLLEDIQRAIKTMRELKALGFQLSLDDFGTGFSSLNYLKKFPIDYLKIDRSFIANMHQNEVDQNIVASIVSLAHTLNLQVIAEGVEYNEHLEQLREMHCQWFQGYLYSPPLPKESFEVLLTEKKHNIPTGDEQG